MKSVSLSGLFNDRQIRSCRVATDGSDTDICSAADIEILTSYITEGIKGTIPAGLELTNHGSNDMTNQVVPFSFDPTADFHDVRHSN